MEDHRRRSIVHNHNSAQVQWRVIAPSGQAVAGGRDFLLLDDDGRIRASTCSWDSNDEAPAISIDTLRDVAEVISVSAPDRVVALSEQLIHVHQAMREQLASLRREAASGSGQLGAGAVVTGDVLSHCLSLCAAVHTHHTGEDDQLLPALRASAPDLAPMIDNLIATTH